MTDVVRWSKKAQGPDPWIFEIFIGYLHRLTLRIDKVVMTSKSQSHNPNRPIYSFPFFYNCAS